MTATEEDKFGSELAAQRFQMLEDIAKELSGEVVFPTCFSVAVRIRQVLDDPNNSMEKIAIAVGGDPLVSSKLLALANSAAYAAGQPVRDIRGAIQRLGLQAVRSISLAIAMKQMLLSRELVAFDELTIRLWQHSLLSASAASIVARHLTRINPDEAFLAGMVHDIGAFYMLYRAAQYPELSSRPESVKYLVAQWHDSIGQSVLGALGMPESIIDAARDHDQLREAPMPPRNLSDVVYVGNFLAGANFEWLYQDIDSAAVQRFALAPQYVELSEEIAEHAKAMGAVFA
ncbi:MAG: HDOD domain-containing protein [Betaproteobacteria bacterium]